MTSVSIAVPVSHIRLLSAAFLSLALVAPVQAGVDLVGLNLSGAGFAPQVLPGVNGTNYIFPSAAHFQQWKARGVNFVRFPIIWERLQPTLNGSLDSTYAALIDQTFAYAAKYGLKVVLDLHNYMRYRGNIIGTSSVPYSAYQNIMTRIATRWRGQSALYGYDIMNEPHDALAYWPTAAQYGINGVRSIDNTRPIFIEGNGWASSYYWPRYNDSLLALTDPANKLIFEAHTYFDADGGGAYATTVTSVDPQVGVDRVKPFVDWLRKNNRKGYIGEVGVPDTNSGYYTALANMLAYLKTHCIPTTYWAAGPGWGNYALSVEPTDGVTARPQWATLKSYLDSSTCSAFGPDS